MDNFPELLQSLSKRVIKLRESILTEEATKTSVVMPFFQLLGYDVFNPEEFLPEYIADVGIKKGEKVDYAIMQDGNPIILIEAKSIQEPLTKHDSQLFRYFGTTDAKFAILTNGIVYKFYTDLEQQNKMDTAPFFEFNLFDLRDNQVSELYKFRKDNFSVQSILNTASELKYTKEIKQYLASQWENPSEEFMVMILNNVYSGKKTKQVIEKFQGLIKGSLKQFVNDLLNDKLKAALANTNAEQVIVPESTIEVAAAIEQDSPEIETTPEEIEGYVTVRFLLKGIVTADRVGYRDNLSYFNILLDNSIRKWICRLGLNGNNKWLQFNDDEKTTVNIESINDIEKYQSKIIEVTKKFA
ncbi:type I restriction endonuclease [Paenibacillus sp. P36]|uniref:type I restriction endonuclease n=1 Tax=Paenibacillus sp. P36 TaxID=3342538 RepID=UPI0038B309AD